MWALNIEKVDNGFVVIYYDEEGKRKEVFKDSDESNITGLKEGVIEMLYSILDYFDERGSKHDNVRIKVGYDIGTVRKEDLESVRKSTPFDVD